MLDPVQPLEYETGLLCLTINLSELNQYNHDPRFHLPALSEVSFIYMYGIHSIQNSRYLIFSRLAAAKLCGWSYFLIQGSVSRKSRNFSGACRVT